MAYHLAPKVTYCVTNDRVVFHNLADDAYVSLEKSESALFLSYAASGQPVSTELIRGLVSAGLLIETPSAFAPLCAFRSVTPDRSYLDQAAADVPLVDAAEAIIGQCSAALSLRMLPLRTIVKGLEQRAKLVNPQFGCDNADTLAVAVSAFDYSTRLIPSSTQCLRRSIALHKYLAGRGIRPNLVFGVKLNAFGAHAWVQYETTVLNDSVENVLRYTPILVI